jgi:hypothetical protein
MDAAATMLAGRTMAAAAARTYRAATLALNAMIEPPRFPTGRKSRQHGPCLLKEGPLRGSLAGYQAGVVMLRKVHTLSKLLRKRTDKTRESLSDFSSPYVTDLPASGQYYPGGQHAMNPSG